MEEGRHSFERWKRGDIHLRDGRGETFIWPGKEYFLA